MIDSNILEYSKLEPLNVSRETLVQLEEFREIIIEKNKKINLISRKTVHNSRNRHIIDSAQAIDFIDIKHSICTDIGSGSGLPGIVLAIIMKNKNPRMKFNLYEKSYHKSKFLKDVAENFDLNVEVFKKDIFNQKNLKSDLIISRAFKPLPVVLNLVNSNFIRFKNIIFFLGKNSKEILAEALRNWQFEYKEKKSLTNKDSFLLNIFNLKKNE